MKTRTFPEHNYRALYANGRTWRIALDPSKPIGELRYPEFYDVKVTSHCPGACPYCYQGSTAAAQHHRGIVARFRQFFGRLDQNQLPFQIAFGGGEPTTHPEFANLVLECKDIGIVPNYTTNGWWIVDEEISKFVLAYTKHCGGVAASAHSHLDTEWKAATSVLVANDVHTNLHVIISDDASVDRFIDIYREFAGKVRYFVLLPMASQGRSLTAFSPSTWKYLCQRVDGSPHDIAFGAGFHPYLAKDRGRFDVSIYEPECMSAYLDLETMRVFRSSFSSEERAI